MKRQMRLDILNARAGYSRMARMGLRCWCDARPEHADGPFFLRTSIDKKLSARIGIVQPFTPFRVCGTRLAAR